MNRQSINFGFWLIGISALVISSAAAEDAGYAELRGNWQAVELVDNGRVVPADTIPAWLPSGGRIEIIDNSIVFTSPKDGQRHARNFSIDATTYPRQLNIIDGGKTSGQGIYRIDNGRLVVCLMPPAAAPRPADFSAREGSQRVMIVFTRTDAKTSTPAPSATSAQPVSATTVLNLPAPPLAPPGQKGLQPLTDTEIATWLPGTWKYNDMYGGFFLSLNKNGTYSTYRESVETSAFQKVFKKLPLSSGTWKLRNGQVVLQCTSAVYADRVYKSFPFTIRSVNSTELQFVDYAGNAGKAVRTN